MCSSDLIIVVINTRPLLVHASEAGEGSLEILVKSTANGQPSLPTHVASLGNAVFAVSFTPDTSADHLIFVTFNDENVPGNNHQPPRSVRPTTLLAFKDPM